MKETDDEHKAVSAERRTDGRTDGRTAFSSRRLKLKRKRKGKGKERKGKGKERKGKKRKDNSLATFAPSSSRHAPSIISMI
jgi:hypothetical protein